MKEGQPCPYTIADEALNDIGIKVTGILLCTVKSIKTVKDNKAISMCYCYIIFIWIGLVLYAIIIMTCHGTTLKIAGPFWEQLINSCWILISEGEWCQVWFICHQPEQAVVKHSGLRCFSAFMMIVYQTRDVAALYSSYCISLFTSFQWDTTGCG